MTDHDLEAEKALAALAGAPLAIDPNGKPYGSRLFPPHAAKLAASGITADVAAERGYVSADTKAQLAREGFGAAQQRPPALVIPIHDVFGQRAGAQVRPDEPRMLSGRPAKYETRSGNKMLIDVPPRVRPHLGNPEMPLILTEGPLKADAAASAGMACVALLGVWAWRGTNKDGGTVALADFENIALNGRRVVIAFDSDVMLKENVHEALARLAALLQRRGAEVGYVYLPSTTMGDKVGLDDWLAAGHTPEAFWSMVTLELRRSPGEAEPEPEDTFDEVDEEAGPELLDDLAEFLGRFVAFPSPEARDAVALWALHTHAVKAAESTPRLAVLSPEKQSGKTRTIEVLSLICRAARHTTNMSASYLFRSVEMTTPTLLIDEVDTIFKAGDNSHEDVRGLINAGHRRGATVGRMVGEGAGMVPQDFAVFCPVALAGIGKIPDTILDRAVLIRMRRRAPDEQVAPFRHRQVEPEGAWLKRRAGAWAFRNLEDLAIADPKMPDGMVDRPADVWEPLLAIADQAGGDWPERARRAAVAINAAREQEDSSYGVKLLVDIAVVFEAAGVDRLPSADLAEKLAAIEESPWGDLRGKALDARGLAWRLRQFDVHPHVIRVGDKTPRGYEFADFHDTFKRYLPHPLPQTATTATPQHDPAVLHLSTATPAEAETKTPPLTCDVADVADVAPLGGRYGTPGGGVAVGVAPNGHVADDHRNNGPQRLVLDLDEGVGR